MSTVEEKTISLSGTVREVMTTQVHTAAEGTLVSAVATLMAENNLRRVIVVSSDKHVLGVISQRDVVKAWITTQEDQPEVYERMQVQDIFSRVKPVVITEDIPLAKAGLVLATNKIGCLPVVNEQQQLSGVLSTTDLIRHISRSDINADDIFQIYDPSSENKTKKPAYIRKINGDIVIPLSNINNSRARIEHVVLGFDPPSSRILVKFVRPNEPEAISTTVKDKNLVIPALGFVRHFDLIGKSNAFLVEDHNHSKFLVLTPKKKT